MIVITIPMNTQDESLARLRARLDHLVKYHPDYAGHKFLVEKAHISLVKIAGEIERSLLSHIQETIRECLGVSS